ncbi:MAG: pantoate--beta-alanine ligase [Pseudomonadota bacterium]
MEVIQSVAVLREQIQTWRDTGERIAFVPTMGNLHEGHLSLVRYAKSLADRVVVSIYVNPTQFGANEDFGAYPRTLGEDCQKLMRAGAHLVFTPDESAMYPFGVARATIVSVPGITSVLDGRHRPGHFDGVASVVCRLFSMVTPDVALFGQKDYQQVMVIRHMVRDLSLPIHVVKVPTQRAEDGLALSSRNQYLTEAQRAIAPTLYRELQRVSAALLDGDRGYKKLRVEARATLEEAGFLPDYVTIRNPQTLKKSKPDDREWVVLGAATLGKARLIDNLEVAMGNDSP